MSLKLILFYLIGFIVLYLEPINIGGFTFGIIWKLIFILVLFLPIFYKVLQDKYMDVFAFILIIFAFKTLISYSSLDYVMGTLTIFIKALMFPIMYLYFVQQLTSKTLLFIAKHFAILIVLSFIPYMLGILEPLGEGYSLYAYGLDGQSGLVGPFINPHSASISLAFAMIVITLQIDTRKRLQENLFYLVLILFAFYLLLNTYARTGIAVYLLTILFISLRRLNLKKIILITSSLLILGGLGAYLVSNNEVVQMRFEDRNKYTDDAGFGSGRLAFWHSAVENWLNDDSSVILIGLGEEHAKDKMYESVGLRIFAHNEFFQVLQQEGLIGIVLFLTAIFLLYQFIRRYRLLKYHKESLALFVAMMLMMMLQGGFYFNVILFLSIYLALLKKSSLEELSNTTKVNNNAQ
jgi:hypothetical protein